MPKLVTLSQKFIHVSDLCISKILPISFLTFPIKADLDFKAIF